MNVETPTSASLSHILEVLEQLHFYRVVYHEKMAAYGNGIDHTEALDKAVEMNIDRTLEVLDWLFKCTSEAAFMPWLEEAAAQEAETEEWLKSPEGLKAQAVFEAAQTSVPRG